MKVRVTVIDVKTIHTDTDGRIDQPMIEVTLQLSQGGKTEQLKFTEMLSNIASLSGKELVNYFKEIAVDYVRTAYVGQRAVDSVTGEWPNKEKILGLQFTVDI